jgi:hypothetical protein
LIVFSRVSPTSKIDQKLLRTAARRILYKSIFGDIWSVIGPKKAYLARHINVDETTDAPMAVIAIRELCGNDALKWKEAASTVLTALRTRISLWDGIVAQLRAESSAAGRSCKLATVA